MNDEEVWVTTLIAVTMLLFGLLCLVVLQQS